MDARSASLKQFVVRNVGSSPKALIIGLLFAFGAVLADWRCPFRIYLGVQCPGCGSVHAISSALKGDFVLAWNQNQMLFITPIFAGVGQRLSEQKSRVYFYGWMLVIVVILAVFTTARNDIWNA